MVPVVEVGDGPVPLLARRVPDLGPDPLPVNHHVVDRELNSSERNRLKNLFPMSDILLTPIT